MHPHFREHADRLVNSQPGELINSEDVGNLHHLLKLALRDNDKLREGVMVSDALSVDYLTLGDLQRIMSEIKDDDLRILLEKKISRALEEKTNTHAKYAGGDDA